LFVFTSMHLQNAQHVITFCFNTSTYPVTLTNSRASATLNNCFLLYLPRRREPITQTHWTLTEKTLSLDSYQTNNSRLLYI
jgi:hypothetical protein